VRSAKEPLKYFLNDEKEGLASTAASTRKSNEMNEGCLSSPAQAGHQANKVADHPPHEQRSKPANSQQRNPSVLNSNLDGRSFI
jgi:hypothetical protein